MGAPTLGLCSSSVTGLGVQLDSPPHNFFFHILTLLVLPTKESTLWWVS